LSEVLFPPPRPATFLAVHLPPEPKDGRLVLLAAGTLAGAIIDATTLARAKAGGLSAEIYLANNDSTGLSEATGDLVTPSLTFTKLNELRLILIR